jgi:hypothetical protein
MQSLGRKIVNFLGMTTLGQKTMANSLSVAVAQDQIVNVSAVVASGKGLLDWRKVTQTELPYLTKVTSNTSGVKAIRIQNLSSVDVFLGGDNTVTVSDGWELPVDAILYLPYISDTEEIWARATDTIDLRVIEET